MNFVCASIKMKVDNLLLENLGFKVVIIHSRLTIYTVLAVMK